MPIHLRSHYRKVDKGDKFIALIRKAEVVDGRVQRGLAQRAVGVVVSIALDPVAGEVGPGGILEKEVIRGGGRVASISGGATGSGEAGAALQG